ncbi:hypothetical protein DFQ28_000708 [Apophysomyces sp. BC1034]|nr:hypothetical protein DFQ29_010126 [Apophysomyces sp. BC1021]KAG0191215.1 hypothetical protein DFQ28_000708 [Apophysomyces sp. BC1034]
MGRLQDKQYTPTFPRKSKDASEPDAKSESDKLQAAFCPPLDPSLIEAIWNDSFDYQNSFAILSELAKEADVVLDKELEESTYPPETSQSVTSSTLSSQQQNDDDEMSPNVEFLLTCFPGYERSNLTRVLKAQGDDVEKTTDVLLNTIFLESETTMNRQTDEENDYERRSELAMVPFNYWHQYDYQIEKIQKVFPKIPKARILGCVQRFKGNLIATVRDIAAKEPTMKPALELCGWQAVRDLEQVEKDISAVMVDRTPDIIHSVSVGVVIVSDGQWSVEKMVQEAIEFLLTYDRQQELLAERLKKMVLTTERIAPVEKDMPVIPEYLLIDNRNNYIDDDPEECRTIAMSLIMERNELFRKAAAAYQRAKNKGPGEGGVAFFYSDEARQYDTKAKDWNMRAARALVRQQRLHQNDDHLLDLHGLTVAEAHVLLKEGVTQWWSRSQMQSSRRQVEPLKVITGIGKHSLHGQSKLLPSVLKWLKREGWLIETANPGCILVKGVIKK